MEANLFLATKIHASERFCCTPAPRKTVYRMQVEEPEVDFDRSGGSLPSSCLNNRGNGVACMISAVLLCEKFLE